ARLHPQPHQRPDGAPADRLRSLRRGDPGARRRRPRRQDPRRARRAERRLPPAPLARHRQAPRRSRRLRKLTVRDLTRPTALVTSRGLGYAPRATTTDVPVAHPGGGDVVVSGSERFCLLREGALTPGAAEIAGSMAECEPVQVDEVGRLATGEGEVDVVYAGDRGDVGRYRPPALPAAGVGYGEAAGRRRRRAVQAYLDQPADTAAGARGDP